MEPQKLYLCASRLLVNPGFISRDEVVEACRGLEREPAVAALLSMMSESPLDLEEHYVEMFELAARCPLNLTFHVSSDEKERVRIMLQYNTYYQRAGLKLAGGELPDHLPAVLEFLAITSPKASWRRGFLRLIEPGLSKLHQCLASHQSPYTGLLETVTRLVQRELAGEVEA